jgi:DNA-directed RNA polymerase specialized sigma24 family protein
MNDIYHKISKLSDKFRTMTYGLTKDKNEIDNVVQELMLYFFNQMNQQTLKKIWESDGEKGIIRYGAVFIRRALTCKNNAYYYKYKKYYSHIIDYDYTVNKTDNDDRLYWNNYNNKNINNIPEENKNDTWKKLENIDTTLEKNFNWYDQKIFELYYYEGNTLDSLAEKTKISRNSLFNTIDKVRTIIKEKLNEKS